MHRPALRAAASILTLALAACALDGSLGPGDELIGHWGGENIELIASATSVQVRLPCSSAVSTGPLVIAEDRTVAWDATVQPMYGEGIPMHFRARVLLTGDVAIVTEDPPGLSAMLEQGSSGRWAGFLCAQGQ